MMTFLLCFFYITSLSAGTILIDPGHGGKESGAIVRYYDKVKKEWYVIKEKDLALKIAKNIQKQLSKNHNVFLTRSVDRFIDLYKRAALAEKIKADIVISVHVNSSKRRGARGFETYYLDNHKDHAVAKVEEVENQNLQGEDLDVNKILIDLAIERTVKISRKLAQTVNKSIENKLTKKYSKLKNRGVKPGLFYILALTKRPGILLETGFLSNLKELKRLQDPKFQEDYARAIAYGIEKYLKQYY